MVPNSKRPVDTPVVESPSADEPEEATDAAAVIEVEEADVAEAGVEAPAADVIEEDVEDVADDVVDGEVEAAEHEVEVEAEAEERPDTPRDDVVVDLFARLRADTSHVDADDASDDEADEVVEDVLEVEVVEVVEVVDERSEELEDEVGEDTPFDQRDADLTPLIVASAKKLKRVLADEQNEVLDRLRRSEPVRSLSDLLPAPAEHLARYRSVIVDDLLAAANAGASLVTPGRVARIDKSDAGAAVAAGEAVLDEWLILPLRERLERCVNDGDGDNAGITKRVRAVYREWKTQHIDEQLDDVIRASHGNGAFAALEPGTLVDWVSDRSHDVCADCDDNTLGGAVGAGTPFPTGHRFPPAHLGCRCLLLPADR
jgi:hypothetical protein